MNDSAANDSAASWHQYRALEAKLTAEWAHFVREKHFQALGLSMWLLAGAWGLSGALVLAKMGGADAVREWVWEVIGISVVLTVLMRVAVGASGAVADRTTVR